MAEIESLIDSIDSMAENIFVSTGIDTPIISAMAKHIQSNAEELRSAFDNLRDDLEATQVVLDDLRAENESLRRELEARPRAGRKPTYSAEERAEIASYRRSHSYKETREHFNISGDTLNRCLREQR